MNRDNVFPQMCAPTEADYIAALRLDVLQLVQHHTQKYIAQRVGVSAKSIHNAQEGKGAADGWMIARLEWEFGPEAVKHSRALGGGNRNREPEVMDALRPHVEAIHTILAEATESRLSREATRGQARAAA